MGFFRDRSTGEVIVLLLAATVCLSIVVSLVSTVVLAFVRPSDSSAGVSFIADILNTLLGLIAGFLAGRTEQKAPE